MSDEKSLINIDLASLSKPATVLVEKISDAIGGLARPWQTVRVAEAEAEVREIQARSEIKISAIQKRAMRRFLGEEAKKQSNIEAITAKALPLLEDKSAPQNVADDWITNFFDKSRIISDGDMQTLWARILAAEANSPGKFARKTVNLLADLDKHDAELFTNLCGFVWVIGTLAPLVFDTYDARYKDRGINFNSLAHLQSLGLIQFDTIAGFQRLELPKMLTVFYFGKPVDLKLPLEEGNAIEIGKVRLTRAGMELAPVCGASPVDGFFDFAYDRWASQSFVPKRETPSGVLQPPSVTPIATLEMPT